MIESNTATRDPEDVTIDPRVGPLADRPVGHDGTRVEVNEQPAWAVSGFLVLPFALVLAGVGVWQVVLAGQAGIHGSAMGWYFTVAGVCWVLAILLVTPLVVIAPGGDPGGAVLRPVHRHRPADRADLGGAAQ